MFKLIKSLAFGLVVALLASACSSTNKKSRALARVAKDWSLVIRASQVIPVYPLSEDVRPGDVFLVQTPIKDQVKQYEADGFLPMDQMIARLRPKGYQAFYAPTEINGNKFSPFLQGADQDASSKYPFPTNAAPRVSFPSYNFSYSRGGGLALALPISGVPVALGATGFEKATGSVTLSDAFTYGIDLISLTDQVDTWASQNQSMLAQIAAQSESATNYVRVVNRVYLVSQVNVALSDAKSGGGSLSGGADQPVDVFSGDMDASANYTNLLAHLNSSVVNAATPGGSLKFASASSRSVSMSETFPRPLVLGYHAYDRPILSNGKLGNALPTKQLLSDEPLTVSLSTYASTGRSDRNRIMRWLAASPDQTQVFVEWLSRRGVDTPPVIWVNQDSTPSEDLDCAIRELEIK